MPQKSNIELHEVLHRTVQILQILHSEIKHLDRETNDSVSFARSQQGKEIV